MNWGITLVPTRKNCTLVEKIIYSIEFRNAKKYVITIRVYDDLGKIYPLRSYNVGSRARLGYPKRQENKKRK